MVGTDLITNTVKKTVKKSVKKAVKKGVEKAFDTDGLSKAVLVAVPVVTVVALGGVVVLAVHHQNEQRKKAASFLSSDVRDALQSLCSLKGEDFVPDGLGSSLFQRRLNTLTDKQLIATYVLIKMAEVLRARGTDVRSLSKDNFVKEVLTLRNIAQGYGRKELIRRLGLFGVDTIRSMLGDAAMLAQVSLLGA